MARNEHLRHALPVLLGIALAGGFAACGVGEARLEPDPLAAATTPLPVDTATVAISDLYARYQATSNVAADGEAQVPARIDGEVIETLVEEGDRVVQGQVLARIDAKRLKLRMQEAGAVLAQRESEYRRQQQLADRGLVSRAAFESLEYEVAELRAAYDIDRLNFSYSEIRAPISGVVAARHIRPGQHVKSGDLAFRISDTSRLVAKLLLPQREFARFAAGQHAALTVDAWPGAVFDAEIVRISPTVDTASGSITATAYVDNEDGRLAPGMFGRFDIRYEKHAATLNIPAQSVVQEDGESVVYRVDNGTAHRQPVEIGIVANGRAEVLSGLADGDVVVVSGSGGLRDGSQVVALGEQRPGADRAPQATS
ncbi:MAG TPA: efflux RND transporter periplasmic adaptor subunit [Woeseiaceae bacterium]|nr:efflux RND transporter periplasmic adaptor subunit [Woeseiaceae bacterium]